MERALFSTWAPPPPRLLSPGALLLQPPPLLCNSVLCLQQNALTLGTPLPSLKLVLPVCEMGWRCRPSHPLQGVLRLG